MNGFSVLSKSSKSSIFRLRMHFSSINYINKDNLRNNDSKWVELFRHNGLINLDSNLIIENEYTSKFHAYSKGVMNHQPLNIFFAIYKKAVATSERYENIFMLRQKSKMLGKSLLINPRILLDLIEIQYVYLMTYNNISHKIEKHFNSIEKVKEIKFEAFSFEEHIFILDYMMKIRLINLSYFYKVILTAIDYYSKHLSNDLNLGIYKINHTSYEIDLNDALLCILSTFNKLLKSASKSDINTLENDRKNEINDNTTNNKIDVFCNESSNNINKIGKNENTDENTNANANSNANENTNSNTNTNENTNANSNTSKLNSESKIKYKDTIKQIRLNLYILLCSIKVKSYGKNLSNKFTDIDFKTKMKSIEEELLLDFNLYDLKESLGSDLVGEVKNDENKIDNQAGNLNIK